MGCNARVGTPGCRLGLPELQLGIIPGFGGTQRLPRLVGLQQAIQMMLTSAAIGDKAGLKAGLLDAVVPQGELLAAAKRRALDIAAGVLPRLQSLQRTGAGVMVAVSLCLCLLAAVKQQSSLLV